MSIINIPSAKDAYVSELFPDINYGSKEELLLDKYGTNIFRCLLQFDISSLPLLGNINSAYLKLYIYRNGYLDKEKTIKIYQLMGGFDEDTVTFNTVPNFSTTILNKYTIINEINTYIKIDITNLVRRWYTGDITNNGIILIGNESQTTLISFLSKEFENSLVHPYLEIDFDGGITPYEVENVVTQDEFLGSTSMQLGGKKAYFGIVNTGEENSAIASIQLSPDNSVWIDDQTPFVSEYIIPPKATVMINTNGCMKYVRVIYKSKVLGQSTSLSIYPTIKE